MFKKWCVIDDQNETESSKENENDSTFKFYTKVIKSSIRDYSNAYILVTVDITVVNDDGNTKVAFKNSAQFTKCVTHINDKQINTSENLEMPIYNLIEYGDSYSDTFRSLWQFKRDEAPIINTKNPDYVTTTNSTSFKYKSVILGKPANDGAWKNAKLVVSLKYLSNFWRSLEMPLIKCKIHLEINRTKNCVVSDNNNDRTFKITNTKLYVPVVTLSTKGNVKLTKQLHKGFKGHIYWNEYKAKIESKEAHDNLTRFYLDASFPGVKRLFVFAFGNTDDANTKVFISIYNVFIDGINFYDQPIKDQIKKHDDIRKIATGHGDDYTKGLLLDYQYFKYHYQFIAVDLSKQKKLDADLRAIQQIKF